MNELNVIYETKSELIHFSKQAMLSHFPHMHKEIEIIYVANGECGAIADRNRYTLANGDLFISFPNQVHYYDHCRAGEYYVTILSPEIVPYLSNDIKANIPADNIVHTINGDTLRLNIEAMTRASGEYRTTKLCGYINLVMSSIMPRLVLRPTPAADSTVLRDLLNFCTANYKNNPTLDDAARELHISKYHISHIMNGRLNLSFTDYMNTLRVEAACDALKDTTRKIADISEDVGFGTIRSFNRTFKEIIGTTPLEYRKEHLAKS